MDTRIATLIASLTILMNPSFRRAPQYAFAIAMRFSRYGQAGLILGMPIQRGTSQKGEVPAEEEAGRNQSGHTGILAIV